MATNWLFPKTPRPFNGPSDGHSSGGENPFVFAIGLDPSCHLLTNFAVAANLKDWTRCKSGNNAFSFSEPLNASASAADCLG